MPINILTLVSGRNGNPRRYLQIMYCMTIAMTLLVSTSLAEENENYHKSKILEQAEDNIRWLRQVKERVERAERAKNGLATLTDLMIKDSFDSQLMSKVDFLYDNQTDLNKELKFVPQVFNCGKEFDIFKVLELAKAHRNITTEQPPCLEDVEDPMCSTTKKNSGESKGMKTAAAASQAKEVVNAYAVQGAIMTTKSPVLQPGVERRTEPAILRPSTPNPLSKMVPVQNKEKPPSVAKPAGGKAVPSSQQKQFAPKGIISKPTAGYRRFNADGIRKVEDEQVSGDQQPRWKAPQLGQNGPQRYSLINIQNNNDAQVKLHEPQVDNLEAHPNSLKQPVRSAQLPIAQAASQQTQAANQPAPSQVVEQPQGKNLVIDKTALQKQQGLENLQADQKIAQSAIINDRNKPDFEQKGTSAQFQQYSQQTIKTAGIKQSLNQPLAEQQKNFNQQLQSTEKRSQQEIPSYERQSPLPPLPLDKQNQQQPQPYEKLNQQPFPTVDPRNQQPFQNLDKQNQQQHQTFEKQNPQQSQTQQQYQTMDKHYQLQYNQSQFQPIEKQFPANTTAPEPERQQTILAGVPGSEQQQQAQKLSHFPIDQLPILKQQTLYPIRIEQTPQTTKPLSYPMGLGQQAAPLPEPISAAKLPSESSNKALSENSSENKTILSAPINVMVMESNSNSSNSSTNTVNLVSGSIPATAYFWGYTMAHSPKLQNYDIFQQEQNRATSIPDKLENNNNPGNIQENPKRDYLYYQDQD